MIRTIGRPALALFLLFALGSELHAQAPAEDGSTNGSTDEDTNRERARALFREGVDHVEARDLEAAATAFEAALGFHDASSIRFNLASALFELDRFTAAYPHLVQLQETSELEAVMARSVRRMLDRSTARIGRLTIRASGSIEEVALDGEVLPAGQEVTPVEPGSHVVEGRVAQEVAVRREVAVAAGERAIVDLTLVRIEDEQDPLPIVETPSRVGRRVGIIAAVVAVVAVGVVLGVVLSGGEDEVQGDLNPGVLRW